MNEPRPRRVRIVVRTRDPLLREQIVERLAGLGEISLDQEGAVDGKGTGGAEGALVETQEEAAHLTPREVEVLSLLAEGLANKEIGARLGVSAHTAKFHVESLLRKLDAANRAEAVGEGIRRGFIGI